MKISQFTNDKGVAVRNQFIILEKGRGANGNFIKREIFQSYESIIAIVITWDDRVDVILDSKYWNYSKTTSKYRNQFLGETTKETEAKINSGQYKLEDLNRGE